MSRAALFGTNNQPIKIGITLTVIIVSGPLQENLQY
jgi:hypothetical protein